MTDTAEVKTATMETTSALPAEETERMSGEIVAALKTVFDPEIPADIYELGLIYKVDLKDDRSVDILMTLTTPNCPAAGELRPWSRTRLPAFPASVSSTSIWSGIRPGRRTGCRTRRASSSICGDVLADWT